MPSRSPPFAACRSPSRGAAAGRAPRRATFCVPPQVLTYRPTPSPSLLPLPPPLLLPALASRLFARCRADVAFRANRSPKDSPLPSAHLNDSPPLPLLYLAALLPFAQFWHPSKVLTFHKNPRLCLTLFNLNPGISIFKQNGAPQDSWPHPLSIHSIHSLPALPIPAIRPPERSPGNTR